MGTGCAARTVRWDQRAPGPLIERATGALAEFRRWASCWGEPPTEDATSLLFRRAELLGLRPSGRTSANGSCRLLRATDAWFAVNLARADDVDAVPAIIGRELAPGEDPWGAIEATADSSGAATIVASAQELGVPAAVLGRRPDGPLPWPVAWRPGGGPPPARRPVVVDLSAMWAGPLCAHLLGRAGAEVTKVEAADRPDGARNGSPEFWRSLHEGQEMITLDFGTASGRDRLAELIAGADAVIDSSRPRALAALGFVAEELAGPHLTWVSITGYGREGPAGDRVAFGDDAAVAGGLVAEDPGGEPVFFGDAVADPLSGIVAAAGAARALAEGGGLVAVAMAGVAAWAAAPGDAQL